MKLSRNVVLACLALCLASPAALAARAGELLFTVGDVQIEHGTLRNTGYRGAVVEVGDTVHTGADGRTQIMMADGALIFLRPASSFRIEALTMPSNQQALPAALAPRVQAQTQPTTGRVVMSLLRGGLRTISGLIGKHSGEEYRLKTPVATIGIRGTDYTAVYCSASCAGAKDGLHVAVSKGAISIANGGGQMELGTNQYAYVGGETQAPERTTAPSSALQDTLPAGEGDGSGDDGAPGEGAGQPTGTESSSQQPGGSPESVPPTPKEELIPVDPRQRSTAYAVNGEVGSATDSVSLLTVVSELEGLTRFAAHESDGAVVTAAIGTASNHDVGYDPVTGIGWGRWHGGQATANGQAVDLSQGSLHWIYGPVIDEGAAALPITGDATYSLAGETRPTDNAGNVGLLGSASLHADFTSQTVFSSLAISINDQLWTASGSGDIVEGAPLFQGNYSVDAGGTSGTGGFRGFFTPPPHEGALPAGAGLSYALDNGQGTTVSGAAAFSQDPVAHGQNTISP